MSRVELIFKRKSLRENIGSNEAPDTANGVVLFDPSTRKLYESGVEYGPMAGFGLATGVSDITGDPTSQNKLPTVKAVYELYQSIVETIDTITQQQIDASQYLYQPEVIIDRGFDSEDNTAVLDYMDSNKTYIYNTPLASLSILSAVAPIYTTTPTPSSASLESTLYFTAADDTFSLSLPQSLCRISPLLFTGGCSYVLSLKDGIVCCDELYSKSSVGQEHAMNHIFTSEATGGKLEPPSVVSVSGANPVIYNTSANTVYKFTDKLSSLTLSDVKANVLETVAYFVADDSFTLTINAYSGTHLYYSEGSVASFKPNSSYAMSIKDGVVIIGEYTL